MESSRTWSSADRIARLIVAFRRPAEETRSVLSDWDPPDLLALSTEYARLFVAGRNGPPAPLEAVAWMRSAGADARVAFLADLGRELQWAGLTLAPDAFTPADHLTVLLELLYVWETRGGAAAERRQFVSRFLASWVPAFLASLEAAGPAPVYRAAGNELRELLETESNGAHVLARTP